jgi:hypothetical protein
VVVVGIAFPFEGLGREVLVLLGKMILERAAERGHVARARDLGIVGQARSVAEGRLRHAERSRPRRHLAGKAAFRPGDMLADRAGDIVRRLGDKGEDGILDGDCLTRLEAEL